MHIRLISLGALAALAGCGDNPASPTAAGPQPLDAVQNQVQALPEAQRNGVLIRAIRDAGQNCQHVESSAPQRAAADGAPIYLARCAGGTAYLVGIGRGGNASVRAATGGTQ